MSGRKQRAVPDERQKNRVLEVTIQYRVDLENFNAEEVLDKLRETGAADITAAKITDGPI